MNDVFDLCDRVADQLTKRKRKRERGEGERGRERQSVRENELKTVEVNRVEIQSAKRNIKSACRMYRPIHNAK